MPSKKKAPRKTRKKSSTTKTDGPPRCIVCNALINPQYGIESFCPVHAGLDIVGQYAAQQEEKGKAVTAFLLRLGSTLAGQAIEQDLHKRAAMIAAMKYAQRKQQQQQQQTRPGQQRSPRDPFAVLGIDRGTATVEIVRARQRELAKIFHVDAGGGEAANTKMIEYNAAAAEAIKILQT